MSRLGAYQAAAARYGTTLVSAKSGLPLRLGGACTDRPLMPAISSSLVRDLRQLGAVATSIEADDDLQIVYLEGRSFQKGDRLP